MGNEDRLTHAQARADRARDRLVADLLALKERLMPQRIFADLVAKTKEAGVEAIDAGTDAIVSRPVAATGIAAAIALFLARKPITRAISSATDETPTDPARSPSRTFRKGKS